MIKSKKTLTALFIIVFLFSGCSSELTIAKINKPAIKNYQESIKQVKTWNKQFIESDPEIVKRAVDEEDYYFDRNIEVRNKIVDSLDLLQKEEFIIVDSRSDNNGKRAESSYFFYNEKIIYAWFKREDNVSNGEVFTKYTPKIENISRQYFEKKLDGLYNIYKVFKNGNEIPSQLENGSERTSYLVTVVKGKQVNYYSVSGAEKYKVVKLYEN
jgi:uncharacterized protein YcfL